MRRALLTAAKAGVTLPAIGDAFMGGYYAGLIDTTRPGSIIASDDYQTGLRYALIVAPKSLESASSTWGAANARAGTKTRWDGLASSLAMNSPSWGAAYHCLLQADPSDGASPWYLPALDELELLYRNLKDGTFANSTSSRPATGFPTPAATNGQNLSSDPTGAGYTSGNPAQTTVAAFKTGGSQALSGSYWSSTELGSAEAWTQSSLNGGQSPTAKGSGRPVRPVRRLVL